MSHIYMVHTGMKTYLIKPIEIALCSLVITTILIYHQHLPPWARSLFQVRN